MPTPESVRNAYDRARPVVEDISRYVSSTLEPYCRSQNYLFHGRIKTADSLAEKLEGGRIDAWSSIDDLYACTIVVPVSTHEEGVIRKLDASFQREALRTRASAKKAPDVFRFDGSRWYGRLRDDAALTRQPGVGSIIFEVQIITAFEYAWVAVTHDLVYKSDTVDWRRQRLSAQLKAAVEQIEVLIGAFETATSAIAESAWPETEVKTEIIKRFQVLAGDGFIPETIQPESWRRFSDNVYALVRSYSKNSYTVNNDIVKLLEFIDSDLRKAQPTQLPTSGTLFQYVLSVVAREDTSGSLSEFTIVPSQELSDIHHLRDDFTKIFAFDGISKGSGSPALG